MATIPVGLEPPPFDRARQSPRPAKSAKSPKREVAAGRFQQINTFADFTLRELTRAELAIWLLLWRDARGGVSRSAQTDLAERAGINERTVRRAIVGLERRRLVTILKRGKLGCGPSSYRIQALPPVG